MKKILVIGAGIFGVTIALTLSRAGHEVVLLEKEEEVMTRVSMNNHFRHHWGYHYPRSKSTSLESIQARPAFEKEYGDCLIPYFKTYYSIAKEKTQTSPGQYLIFCEDLKLPYEIVPTDEEIINKERVAMTLKVPERAYNPYKLKSLCKEKLKNSTVDLRVNSQLIDRDESKNIFKIKNLNREYTESFDIAINATYANINKTNKILKVETIPRQYELFEMLQVRIPGELFGTMIMDGDFTSVIPMGEEGVYTITNAKECVLKRIVSDNFDGDVESFGEFKSNREGIMRETIKDFPILKKAEFIKSMFIVKIVKANKDDTDERPSEVTEHGNGIYSVFAGKVITSVDVANKLKKIIEEKENQ
jgi:hypothetical protein